MRSQVPTLQPPNSETGAAHSEAFHIQLIPLPRQRRRMVVDISDVELYLSFWYLCTIPYGATRDKDYGAHFVGAHERGYNSELVDVAEAVWLLSGGAFEYRHSGAKPGDGIQGILVDKQTGHRIDWGDLRGNDVGAVEALIVASGWECISSIGGSVEEMVSRLEI